MFFPPFLKNLKVPNFRSRRRAAAAGNDMAMKKSIAAVRHTNSDALIFYAIVLAHGKAAGQPQDNAPRYPAMV